MLKFIGSKLPIRTVIFTMRRIKCLTLQKSADLEAWLKVWRNTQKLPEREKERVEWAIFKGMKDITFTFEEGHHLYNEGLCRGLGRKAMWLGAHLSSNALERQREEVRQRENILNLMFKTLNPHKSDGLSKEDEMVVKIINGRFSSIMSVISRY